MPQAGKHQHESRETQGLFDKEIHTAEVRKITPLAFGRGTLGEPGTKEANH